MKEPLLIRGDKNTNSFVVACLDNDLEFNQETINTIKSWAWSSNCRFFYILLEKIMVLGNTEDESILVSNKDPQLFELFLSHQK